MQEDLEMFGNQYTYATTAYTVSYAVMQIPSTLIIQKIRPSYWLAFMEIGWGVFTFAQASLSNVPQLYAFRFMTYGLLPNGILAVWPKSVKLKEFAFLTDGVQLMTAIYYTWANEVCSDDNEERAFVVSSMNGFQYAVAAWLPIVIFPQTEAPTFRKGFPATFGFVIAALVVIVITQLLALREKRQKISDAQEDGVTTPEEDGISSAKVKI
ncbi:hypothetical protein AN4142.2 [Paecilomyces variotii No. 5]|uniref:Pantothenate transporter n=1 Tax=Byssochlamys spectabilis (strain No. 5 / NBRC 109023) TaxID=1356009 RepID=V5FMD7_BYSSN|nr:hypothetical protein AN4142.2 [Paecilomyces variotii No. 5]